MRKPLKSEFVEALGEAVAEYGSQSELARQSGVGQATINSILNDKNKTWQGNGDVFWRVVNEKKTPFDLRRHLTDCDNGPSGAGRHQ